MAVLHDFHCKPCNVVFEDVSDFNRALGGVEPVACPQCKELCGIIWLKSPGMNGDENISAHEKVAAALRLGFNKDGKLAVPQTRSDLRKIREALGDFRVGNELMQKDSKGGDLRSTAEKEADKAATIDAIRQRRAKFRNREIPRVTVDPEVASAMKSQPITDSRILTKKGV